MVATFEPLLGRAKTTGAAEAYEPELDMPAEIERGAAMTTTGAHVTLTASPRAAATSVRSACSSPRHKAQDNFIDPDSRSTDDDDYAGYCLHGI